MKDNDTNKRSGRGLGIRVIGGIATLVAIALAFVAFVLASRVGNVQEEAVTSEATYIACNDAISSLQKASDYLTTQARAFVTTGRRECMDAYVNELEVANNRGKAVEMLRTNFSNDSEVAKNLEEALNESDGLAQIELAAMKFAAQHYGIQDLPKAVAEANTSVYKREGEQASDLSIATELVLDKNYDEVKHNIQTNVEESSDALLASIDERLKANEALVKSLLFQLRVVVALLLCDIMILVLTLFVYVLKPIGRYIKQIKLSEPLDADGAYELHYLADAYNAMYEDNAKRIEQLRAFAERDPLTGISNRSGYDHFLATHTRNIVLLLLDIDNFADYNAVYGHDTGDAVLIRMAEALTEVFRSTDFPCRIEGDMFAVIMTNMSVDLRDVIVDKVESVNSMLTDETSDLPLVTLSVGAAFSTEGMSDMEIYHAADSALKDARKSESNSIVFYGEGNIAESDTAESNTAE